MSENDEVKSDYYIHILDFGLVIEMKITMNNPSIKHYVNSHILKVLIAGFGRKGHAKGDIPGVRFKVVAVKGISLKALYTGKAEKKWSKYKYIIMLFY